MDQPSVLTDYAQELGNQTFAPIAPSVGFTTVDSNLARGAYVIRVTQGSSAEKAGILPGDLLTAVGGDEIASSGQDYALRIDTSLVWTELGEPSDTDSVLTRDWTGRLAYDPTSGNALRIELVNELAGL